MRNTKTIPYCKKLARSILTKKTKVNEGEFPQYYVEHNHEPIIEPAVFDQVQLKLERRYPGRNRTAAFMISQG